MMISIKKAFLFLLLSLICLNANAQISNIKGWDIFTDIPATVRLKVSSALDTLLNHIDKNRVDTSEVTRDGSALSVSMLGSIKGLSEAKNHILYRPKLINFYPVDTNEYYIVLEYTQNDSLRAIVNLTVNIIGNKVTFAIPLRYLTKNWSVQKVGHITYHYPDRINTKRANLFDRTNTTIAHKLGLKVEDFDFYLCNNYQEILKLIGFEYDATLAGKVTNGYGVDTGTIFSINHNEDFSHDTFHYYAAKVRRNPRNSAAEEGFAYSWGNAYYTDANGEMITQKQLVVLLNQYLVEHPKTSLLDLFTRNPKIFPFQTKVRSLIASLISDEVERQKGTAGVKLLIDCGKGDDNFFKVTNNLIGINVVNFDERAMALLKSYHK